MKDRILMLIVGILIGAIITTGVFLIVNKNQQNTQNSQQQQRMQQFQNMMGNPNGIYNGNGIRRYRGGNYTGPGAGGGNGADTTTPQTTTGNSV